MIEHTQSVHGARIRLTDERWAHIMEEHGELAGMRQAVLDTLATPLKVVAGHQGERLAYGERQPGKYLVVVYREKGGDGFVITAFLTRRLRPLERRQQLWP